MLVPNQSLDHFAEAHNCDDRCLTILANAAPSSHKSRTSRTKDIQSSDIDERSSDTDEGERSNSTGGGGGSNSSRRTQRATRTKKKKNRRDNHQKPIQLHQHSYCTTTTINNNISASEPHASYRSPRLSATAETASGRSAPRRAPPTPTSSSPPSCSRPPPHPAPQKTTSTAPTALPAPLPTRLLSDAKKKRQRQQQQCLGALAAPPLSLTASRPPPLPDAGRPGSNPTTSCGPLAPPARGIPPSIGTATTGTPTMTIAVGVGLLP